MVERPIGPANGDRVGVHVPCMGKFPEQRARLYEAMCSPALSTALDTELNNMYQDSLRQLGVSENDIAERSEAFRQKPLNLQKIEVAYDCKVAAERCFAQKGNGSTGRKNSPIEITSPKE